MRMAAGAKAWTREREQAAIERKNMDMTSVNVKEIRMKKKKFPGSRRRFVMKYRTKLKVMALTILYGISVNILAKASADGWYKA